MTPSTALKQRHGPPGSPCLVAVLGPRGTISRRIETALRPTKFVYHESPDDLLGLSEACTERPAGQDRAGSNQPVPIVFLFNFVSDASKSLGRARKTPFAKWFRVMNQLDSRCPSNPIVVVADETQHKKLVKSALDSGADEVIGIRDSEIAELVRTRFRCVLDSFEHRFNRGPDPDAEPMGQVVEADPLARLRRAAERLPTADERAGPILDLLDVAVPELRAPSGRLDAKKIAERLGVSLTQLARATPVSRQALSGTPDSRKIQAALDPIARVLAALAGLLPAGARRNWLNTSHFRLDGATPLAAILDGRAERVARMLESVASGGVE